MAKDENGTNDADLGRLLDGHPAVGTNDEAVSEGLRVRTEIFLEGQFRGRPEERLVDRIEATTADESGLVETTTLRMKAASGCGHVLHAAPEMGLQCTSCVRLRRPEPGILCIDCAADDRNACSVCNTIVCHECRQQRWIEGELRNACRACLRTRIRWQRVVTIAKYGAIAAGVLYIIFV
jgi:hypothetical protein